MESKGLAYTSTESLVALEQRARDLRFIQKAKSHQQLAGRMRSSLRGRGLSFEELRDYMPGDDIRSIDWRVTARTSRPAVRVYSEEKERPTLIVVDQRLNMFFGSRLNMKSVTAAETAMLCGWRILGSGDRVGGFVFNDHETVEVKPHRSRNSLTAFASSISTMNNELHVGATTEPNPGQLNSVLRRVSDIAHHDHLICVITDFDGYNDETRDQLLRLTVRNDVYCLLVYDPFMLELPKTGDLVVSRGALQAELPLRHDNIRNAIDGFARERGRALKSWQRELGLAMLPVSSAEETPPQLLRLLEQSSWKQRRH